MVSDWKSWTDISLTKWPLAIFGEPVNMKYIEYALKDNRVNIDSFC